MADKKTQTFKVSSVWGFDVYIFTGFKTKHKNINQHWYQRSISCWGKT